MKARLMILALAAVAAFAQSTIPSDTRSPSGSVGTIQSLYPTFQLVHQAQSLAVVSHDGEVTFRWRAGEVVKNFQTGHCAYVPKDGGFLQSKRVPCPDSKLMKIIAEVVR